MRQLMIRLDWRMQSFGSETQAKGGSPRGILSCLLHPRDASRQIDGTRLGDLESVKPTHRHLAMLYPAILAGIIALVWLSYRRRSSKTAIPWTTTDVPLLGSAQSYAADPVRFLLEQKAKLGDIFRVDLLVLRVTFLIGPKVRTLVKLEETPFTTTSVFSLVESMASEGDQRGASQLLASDIDNALRLDRWVHAVSGMARSSGQGIEYWYAARSS